MRNRFLTLMMAGAVAACSGANDASEDSEYPQFAEDEGYVIEVGDDGDGYAMQVRQDYGAGGMQQVQIQGQSTGQAPAQMQRPPANTGNGMQLVKIIDRNGFEKPMVAYVKEIPAGWRTEGGVNWQMNNAGCGKMTPSVEWRAFSPDGMNAVEILAGETWSGHNLPAFANSSSCPNVQITDARQYIMQMVQRMRPGARILDYRDRSDETQQLQQQLPQPQRDPYGGETRSWLGAGQALIAYNMNGVEMREIIGTVVVFNLMRMPDMLQGGSQDFISITAMPGFAMRAPEGKLDFDLAEKIRLSGSANPAYQQKMAAYHARNNKIQADSAAKIAAINRKGAADRSAIIAQNGRDISDIQMSIYRTQSASGDYIQRESSEAIRGVETYNDQYNGGTVELDNTYEYNWQLENGDIVQTNDANFNVYEATGQFGNEMEVTE